MLPNSKSYEPITSGTEKTMYQEAISTEFVDEIVKRYVLLPVFIILYMKSLNGGSRLIRPDGFVCI